MSDLATVSVYTTRSDAEIAKARLEADGIDAIVIADDEGGLNPGFYSRYGVRVVVTPDDLPDARESLGIDVVAVPGEILESMVAHARSAAPIEACGLLAGTGGEIAGIYPMRNLDEAPDRFTLDPAEHFAAWRDATSNGWEIVGSFHSHPDSAPIPSEADLDGGTEPGWVNFIVGVEAGRISVQAWRYEDGAGSPVGIERR